MGDADFFILKTCGVSFVNVVWWGKKTAWILSLGRVVVGTSWNRKIF